MFEVKSAGACASVLCCISASGAMFLSLSCWAQDELDFLIAPDKSTEQPAPENEVPATEAAPSDAELEVIKVSEAAEQSDNAFDTHAPPRRVTLEEIVVTAQKREENVRDVPIAISVMSGDDLKEAAISRFDDMARLIPNVSFNSDFNSLYMRGIGTAELNILSEQAVSYVLDGVYVARLDYLKPGFMDVERIEVLKGPQGTLYGRNATAGVMSITYGEPTREWEGDLSISGGERNSRKAEGVLSGPLTEDLSFRASGSFFREDGHTLNRADDDTLGDKVSEQLRLKLNYEFSDGTYASLAYHHFDYFVGVWGGNEAFAYPAALKPAIVVLDPTFETELNREGSSNLQNNSTGRGRIVPLQITVERWDHTFTSITAYSELNDHQGGDIDGSAADLGQIHASTESNAVSQEFRLVSPPGALEYVGGLFLYKSDFVTQLDIPLVPNPGVNTVSGVPALGSLLQILNPVLGAVADPALALAGLGDHADNLHGYARVRVESLGLFGQATWHITDSLALLAGLRYSRDSRHGEAEQTNEGPLPIWQVLTLGGFAVNKHAVDEDLSPKVSLTWEPHEAVTIYGTYAKGFRAGSYNIAALGGPQDFEFKPEYSTTYEAGIKSELFGGLIRFNIGGFQTTYEDYQLATFNGFGYDIANAEEVESKGIESDLTALLFPGVILTAAVGYSDGKFIKYDTAGCPTVFYLEEGGIPPQGIAALPPELKCDLSGQPLFRAPKWTGNVGLNFEIPIVDSLSLFAGASASYKGFEYMDSDLDPLDSQDSYWLYNALAGLKHPDGRWSIVVHGKNLGDRLVKTFSGDIPIQAGAHWALTNSPRAFVVTAQYRFR